MKRILRWQLRGSLRGDWTSFHLFRAFDSRFACVFFGRFASSYLDVKLSDVNCWLSQSFGCLILCRADIVCSSNFEIRVVLKVLTLELILNKSLMIKFHSLVLKFFVIRASFYEQILFRSAPFSCWDVVISAALLRFIFTESFEFSLQY